MFIYKNQTTNEKGKEIIFYQGFPLSNVLDFELLSMTNTVLEETQQKLLVRLKDKVLSVVDEPKFNAKGIFTKTVKVEKSLPVIHSISDKADIVNFFASNPVIFNNVSEKLNEMASKNLVEN